MDAGSGTRVTVTSLEMLGLVLVVSISKITDLLLSEPGTAVNTRVCDVRPSAKSGFCWLSSKAQNPSLAGFALIFIPPVIGAVPEPTALMLL